MRPNERSKKARKPARVPLQKMRDVYGRYSRKNATAARAEVIDLGETPLLRVPAPSGFPEVLRLGSKSWKILYSSNLIGSRGEFGHTDIIRHRIVIGAEQDREQMVDTLLHEAIHVIMHSGPLALLDGDTQEAVARTLTPGLIDLLRSNRAFWV